MLRTGHFLGNRYYERTLCMHVLPTCNAQNRDGKLAGLKAEAGHLAGTGDSAISSGSPRQQLIQVVMLCLDGAQAVDAPVVFRSLRHVLQVKPL